MCLLNVARLGDEDWIDLLCGGERLNSGSSVESSSNKSGSFRMSSRMWLPCLGREFNLGSNSDDLLFCDVISVVVSSQSIVRLVDE